MFKMQKKCLGTILMVVCLVLVLQSNVGGVRAGERTDVLVLPEAYVELNVSFDDVYYLNTFEGTVTIHIEVPRVQYKVVITDVKVSLDSVDILGDSTWFDNPTWDMRNRVEFADPSGQSWTFLPSDRISTPYSAYVSVIVGLEVYTSSEEYESYYWETLPEEMMVRIKEVQFSDSSDTDGFSLTEKDVSRIMIFGTFIAMISMGFIVCRKNPSVPKVTQPVIQELPELQTIFCHMCGMEIYKSKNFCTKCGVAI